MRTTSGAVVEVFRPGQRGAPGSGRSPTVAAVAVLLCCATAELQSLFGCGGRHASASLDAWSYLGHRSDGQRTNTGWVRSPTRGVCLERSMSKWPPCGACMLRTRVATVGGPYARNTVLPHRCWAPSLRLSSTRLRRALPFATERQVMAPWSRRHLDWVHK